MVVTRSGARNNNALADEEEVTLVVNDAANNNNVASLLLTLHQVMRLPNAMITGITDRPVTAEHLNTILLKLLGVTANRSYSNPGHRKSRLPDTTESTHMENCERWIKQFISSYILFVAEGQKSNAKFKQIEGEGGIKQLRDWLMLL